MVVLVMVWLATTIALQILDEINSSTNDLTLKAVKYLEHTFIKDRPGWITVPEKVNDYPHAPWWQWTNDQTVIDLVN